MQIGACNRLEGAVLGVHQGGLAARLQVDIGGANTLTSIITMDSVNRRGLGQGQAAIVMLTLED